MARLLPFLVKLALMAGPIGAMAQAPSECSPLLGSTISPISIDELMSLASKLPNEKGEFETTAAFSARVDALMPPELRGPVAVTIPLDPSGIRYNADTKELQLFRSVLPQPGLRLEGVFGYGRPLYQKVPFGTGSRGNVAIGVTTPDISLGSYIATTAMGAKVNVSKVRRTTRVLFERKAEINEDLFTPTNQRVDWQVPVVTFPNVEADYAQRVKAKMLGAMWFTPKPPYFVRGKVDWGGPTFDAPLEINETLEVAIGDLQCFLMTDPVHVVVALVKTR